METITAAFNKQANSQIGFTVTRLGFAFKKALLSGTGLISNWAIDRDVLLDKLREILPQGHMTPLNAAALMCATAIKHKHSRYDQVSFFENFLKLYNARNLEEVCEIERVKRGTPDWDEINSIYAHTPGNNTKKLEATKIHSWAKDLESATKGTMLGRLWGHHKTITAHQVKKVLAHYRQPEGNNVALMESDGKETLSAFPKNEYLPLLLEQRRKGAISETQCGIILCFILHSRETRRSGASYVTHPMAVANLVRMNAEKYLDREDGYVWMAMVVALLHDGGEKSNINLDTDLHDLLPQKIIDAVKCLHKDEGESYFSYLNRCANNPLAMVVKLCDIYHNSSDANEKPSFKQEYAYPIAANFIDFRLKNPDSKMSVEDWVVTSRVCDEETFKNICHIADTDRKVDVSLVRDKLGKLNFLKSIKQIFAEEDTDAHTRREESFALHL